MSKMAFLMATDSWEKIRVYQRFLADGETAYWRTQLRLTQEYVDEIPFPLNLYFFYRNLVQYRSRCLGICLGSPRDWPLAKIPRPYQAEKTPFTMAIKIERPAQVPVMHISKFAKWDAPDERFERGQQALLRVGDLGSERR